MPPASAPAAGGLQRVGFVQGNEHGNAVAAPWISCNSLASSARRVSRDRCRVLPTRFFIVAPWRMAPRLAAERWRGKGLGSDRGRPAGPRAESICLLLDLSIPGGVSGGQDVAPSHTQHRPVLLWLQLPALAREPSHRCPRAGSMAAAFLSTPNFVPCRCFVAATGRLRAP